MLTIVAYCAVELIECRLSKYGYKPVKNVQHIKNNIPVRGPVDVHHKIKTHKVNSMTNWRTSMNPCVSNSCRHKDTHARTKWFSLTVSWMPGYVSRGRLLKGRPQTNLKQLDWLSESAHEQCHKCAYDGIHFFVLLVVIHPHFVKMFDEAGSKNSNDKKTLGIV